MTTKRGKVLDAFQDCKHQQKGGVEGRIEPAEKLLARKRETGKKGKLGSKSGRCTPNGERIAVSSISAVKNGESTERKTEQLDGGEGGLELEKESLKG